MPTTPVRYPNGVNNLFPSDLFNRLPFPEQTDYHFFYEEFDQYTAAQWVVGGVGAPVAPLLVAGDGGILSLTDSAADNDNNWIQQAVTAWTLAAGKQFFFSVRASVSSALQSDLVFGLQVAVAANNFITPTDGIFVYKADDGLTWILQHRVGGVAISSAVFGTTLDATQFEVGFYYDGKTTIQAGINDRVNAAITVPVLTAVPLKFTAGVQNGDAVARTMLLDQILVAKER